MAIGIGKRSGSAGSRWGEREEESYWAVSIVSEEGMSRVRRRRLSGKSSSWLVTSRAIRWRAPGVLSGPRRLGIES